MLAAFSGIAGLLCALSVHDLHAMQRQEGNLSLNQEVMGITGGKGTLSCHLVLSLGTEHEFSLAVRAVSNIQDKLPSSLLHAIPHIYNHCTTLNRLFSICAGCLQ